VGAEPGRIQDFWSYSATSSDGAPACPPAHGAARTRPTRGHS
jgi:hypothetical protein